MPKIAILAKKSLMISMAMLLIVASPAPLILAEDGQPASDPNTTPTTESTSTPSSTDPGAVSPTPAPSPPPPTNYQGPTQPPGPESKTYHYNASTGLWENDYYTWDPVTKQTKPKTPQTYSYNPATGRWDTTQWQYNPASGKYEPNIVSTSTQPLNAAITNTGPDSTNAITSGGGNNATFNSFFNGTISNGIYSTAASGNATVSGNTLGGSALTGDAAVISNLFNLLQSSAGFGNGNLTTFTHDINGNVVGDLYIDPSMFTQMQPANNVASGDGTDVTINSQANGQINNNIVLDAASGNASVTGNTTGGNATSGTATAVANVVNLINSIIGANQSFLGNINIYGNFEGDILLPPETLTALLASNGVPTATIDTAALAGGNLLGEFNSNQAINNNVQANATSGNATVDSNTTAGSATTGNASTKLTVLNLTGSQVIGSNALLVFVNVGGTWLGAIVNAPGSTAAALGGGISGNTCGTTVCGGIGDLDMTATSNNQINNNILANAASGDADVSHNTTGGNATTGDANVAVNLTNITNSTFNLSNWFGVLFINVFGSWKGSFGINTDYGNPAAAPAVANANNPATAPQVFRFVPSTDDDSSNNANARYAVAAVDSSILEDQGATTDKDSKKGAVLGLSQTGSGSNSSGPSDFSLPLLGAIIAAALLGLERLITLRQQRRKAAIEITPPLKTLSNE